MIIEQTRSIEQFFPFAVNIKYFFKTKEEANNFELFAEEYLERYDERITQLERIALSNMTGEEIYDALPEELQAEWDKDNE